MSFKNSYSLLLNRRQLATLILGFASGLPLALTSSTLQAWYTVAGISIMTIGFLSFVGMPYNYKIFWAPLMDRFIPPLLGRRRGWIIITQLALVITITAMALLDPKVNPLLLAIIALFVAFLSASQDIVIDAYRVDIIRPEERGYAVALTTTGYRIAMLISGGLALILADHFGWRTTYLIMAAAMLVGIIGAWFGPEPEIAVQAPTGILQAIREPFREFMSRKNAFLLLLLVVLYKLGDAFTVSLTSTFLLRDLGFSLTDVGMVFKTGGLIAMIAGSFLGGALIPRLGLFRSLFWFGAMQATAGLLFMALALVGKNFPLLVTTIVFDCVASGMATAAFISLLMSFCDQRYSATQYALLSALATVGRVFVGPFAAWLIKDIGWPHFFAVSFLISIPGLILLCYLAPKSDSFFPKHNNNLNALVTDEE